MGYALTPGRYGRLIFSAVALIIVGIFIHVSNSLVHDLSVQERERMEIWADATKEIISSTDSRNMADVDIDFLLRIISRNTTIPVLLTDDDGNILQHRNFTLPEPIDSLNPMDLTAKNEAFLQNKLQQLSHTSNVIEIAIAPDETQHLYYEDSILLKRLSYFPYVQLLVILTFIAVGYFAIMSTKKAEQNKVWVGLSKETAHQLGTPISSLMAWMELIGDMGVDAETVAEMNKDVNRLSTIASRFSKIGSKPQMISTDINDVVGHAVSYMSTRISPRISLSSSLAEHPMQVMACAPLFEWVMENLIKNAVDAMEGHGSITVTAFDEKGTAIIEVEDTGKGISRKNFKTVFNPGFTTKTRGWGLGLTLAKRIIEQYHLGKIYVKTSTPGGGTTFRIELPLCSAEM
jgi:signal transduction histidine kinase